MKEIKISATTDKGEKAMNIHIGEFKKLKFKDRLIFKTAGYKHEVISEKPCIIKFTANNKHIANPMFFDLLLGEIQNALEVNGAVKDTDFKMEVI